jgi:hypothetical protein
MHARVLSVARFHARLIAPVHYWSGENDDGIMSLLL